jgi:tetratricopeptide (TPR) repeat protein
VFSVLSVQANTKHPSFDDCDKYRRQGDSLFKVCSYLAAIKKYKSCLIFKDKDEYSTNKIKIIDDIFNKMRIAVNLSNAGKNPEAIEIYHKVLVLNPDDIESKKSIASLLESEADKKIAEGDNEEAITLLNEAIPYLEMSKKTALDAKLKLIEDKKKNPEYLKIMEESAKLMKAAKYQEASKKYATVFNLTGFQKDRPALKAIGLIQSFQEYKKNAEKFMQEGDFLGVIGELGKILKEGVNDAVVKTDLLKAYENQADKLLNEGKKDESILLISKAIELFDGDNKKQNTLQKKLKELTTAKKTTKD